MTLNDQKTMHNIVTLAAIAQTTKNVIKHLDGNGLQVKAGDEALSDAVLEQVIVSRIRNNLQKLETKGE